MWHEWQETGVQGKRREGELQTLTATQWQFCLIKITMSSHHTAGHRLQYQILRNQRQVQRQRGGSERQSHVISINSVTIVISWSFLSRPSSCLPGTSWAGSTGRWWVPQHWSADRNRYWSLKLIGPWSLCLSAEWQQPVSRGWAHENHRVTFQKELLQVYAAVGGASKKTPISLFLFQSAGLKKWWRWRGQFYLIWYVVMVMMELHQGCICRPI